jgi:dipeptidyl aminopeptidase/acylaminoacyl peptidase
MYKSKMFVHYDKTNLTFCFTADDFEGLNCEPFSFKTKRGDTLNGCFYSYPDYIEDRIIVFDHGMGCGHIAYLVEINILTENGYTVYTYDHTGTCRSEGESIRSVTQSLSDLDACLTALRNTKEYKNADISVMGHSWGGYSSMNVSAFHPQITHVLALSGFISLNTILSDSFVGLLKPYKKAAITAESKLNPKYSRCDARDSLKNSNAKCLIIHSSDDPTVKFETNFAALKSALGDNKRLCFLEVSGKAHHPHYTLDSVAYRNSFASDLKKISKSKHKLSDEEKQSFTSKYDWPRMADQDMDVWNIMLEFLAS